jgi:hypothetical protein
MTAKAAARIQLAAARNPGSASGSSGFAARAQSAAAKGGRGREVACCLSPLTRCPAGRSLADGQFRDGVLEVGGGGQGAQPGGVGSRGRSSTASAASSGRPTGKARKTSSACSAWSSTPWCCGTPATRRRIDEHPADTGDARPRLRHGQRPDCLHPWWAYPASQPVWCPVTFTGSAQALASTCTRRRYVGTALATTPNTGRGLWSMARMTASGDRHHHCRRLSR